jgi:hypothetical protein
LIDARHACEVSFRVVQLHDIDAGQFFFVH